MTDSGPIDAPFGQPVVPSAAEPDRDHPDPHGFAPLVARLDATVAEPRRAVLLMAAATMEPGERLFGILAGRFLGHIGVALLTNRRVLASNARSWKPSLAAIALHSHLTVETWQVDGTLTLRFSDGDQTIVVDGISDHEGGREFAAAVRSLAV